MKRRFLLLAALAAAVPLSAQEGVEQTLELPASVDRALHNNQKLLLAQEDIKIAEQRLREAQSQHYPQIGLNFNSSRYLAEQSYVLPPEFGTVLLRPSHNLESDTFYSARAWLKQPLYSGGRTRNNIRLSRTNLERARIQFEEVRSQVVFDVTKAFYDVLLYRRQAELYESAAAAVGALASSGAAEARAAESRLRRGLAEKRRQAEKARLDFLNALGVELYTQLDIQGELKPVTVAYELPKLLAWAQESRAEIRRTDFQQEIDRLTVNLSQAERYPVVAFGAAYELNDREFPLDTTQWSATLNVSLPVFDGFSSRARIRQKRSRANQSRIQRTEIEDQVNLEVRQSHADLAFWREEGGRRGQDASRSAEAAASARGQGAAERARLELWSLETQEAYWEAVHGQQVALSRLQKAVGRPLGE